MRIREQINYITCLCFVSVAVILCLRDCWYSPETALLSLAVLPLLFCLFFAISGQWLRSVTMSGVMVSAIHFLDSLKMHYYIENLRASDIFVVTDPSNWETLLHYPIAGGSMLAWVAVFVWAALAHRRRRRCGVYGRVCAVIGAVVMLLLFYRRACDAIATNEWGRNLPTGQGVVANLVFSSRQFTYKPPTFDGNDSLFLNQAATVDIVPPGRAEVHPDIIVFLQESTVNPEIYNLPGVQLPPLTMFQSNPATRIQGWLRVHTFGGRTWMSEFALFSGLVSRDFGSAAGSVFYTVTPHLHTSLFKVLKASGYSTAVLTPCNKSDYHADSAYRDFGVDRVIQPQDLGYPANNFENLWEIESREMVKYAKKILETQPRHPMLLFVLSMKEHGPYNSKHADTCGLSASIKDPTLVGRLNDYMERLKSLNSATEEFSDYLLHRKRPTIFLYFGDHQANIESPNIRYRVAERDPAYLTQFVLRDNLTGPPPAVGEVTDLAFIGGLLLERAGIKPDALFSANIRMRKLCHGRLQDCPDSTLVQSYNHYLYQTLHAAD